MGGSRRSIPSVQKRPQPCQGRVPPRAHSGGENQARGGWLLQRERGAERGAASAHRFPQLSAFLTLLLNSHKSKTGCMQREGRDDFSCHLQPSSPLRQTFPAVRQEAHCPARIPFLMRTSHTQGRASCGRSSLSQGVAPERGWVSSGRSHHGSGCPLRGARPKPHSRGLTGS